MNRARAAQGIRWWSPEIRFRVFVGTAVERSGKWWSTVAEVFTCKSGLSAVALPQKPWIGFDVAVSLAILLPRSIPEKSLRCRLARLGCHVDCRSDIGFVPSGVRRFRKWVDRFM